MSRENRQVFKISSSGPNRVAWNKDHDTQLLSLVQRYQGRNWKKIAEEMQRIFGCPELSAKKCRERWCNCANPDLDKTALTEEEELFLLLYHHEHKNKWTIISKYLPNRNSTKLKNNFSSFLRKVCRKIVLNEKETINSMVSYIQILYATALIYDLTTIKENCEKVELIAPLHIYEHVKEKRITGEQCLKFIRRSTELLFNNYKTHEKLKKLTIDKIEYVKNFLQKILPVIKSRFSPDNSIPDNSLLETVECVLSKEGDISAEEIPKKSEEFQVKKELPEKEVPHLKEVLPQPITSMNKEIGYVPYQQPPISFENEILQIPELQAFNFNSLQSPLQFSTEAGFPMPTFASPAFQASLQPSQPKLGTPMFSPLYCQPIPIMKSPTEQYYMLKYQTPTPEVHFQSKASDFTAFTNKYI